MWASLLARYQKPFQTEMFVDFLRRLLINELPKHPLKSFLSNVMTSKIFFTLFSCEVVSPSGHQSVTKINALHEWQQENYKSFDEALWEQSSKEHKLLSFTFLTRFSSHIYDGRLSLGKFLARINFSSARDLFSFFALLVDEFLELWKDWLWTFFRSEVL